MMVTVITVRIVHDNPNAVEYIKTLIRKIVINTLNTKSNNITVTHENNYKAGE